MHYDSRTGRPSDLIGVHLDSDPKGQKPLRLELPMRDAETYDLVRKQESDHRPQGEQELRANHRKRDRQRCVRQHRSHSKTETPTVGRILKERPSLHCPDDNPPRRQEMSAAVRSRLLTPHPSPTLTSRHHRDPERKRQIARSGPVMAAGCPERCGRRATRRVARRSLRRSISPAVGCARPRRGSTRPQLRTCGACSPGPATSRPTRRSRRRSPRAARRPPGSPLGASAAPYCR